MKKMKVSILALSVLVGGAVFASAASDKSFIASTSDILVTNVAPLVYVLPSGFPSSIFLNETNLSPATLPLINTDSQGKIIGVLNLIKDWTSGPITNLVPSAQTVLYGDVKGSVKASKMGQVTIQASLKLKGYSSPTTNVFVINSQKSGGASTLNVNFKATGAPVAVNTNTGTWKLVGTSKIQFKSGTTSIVSGSKSFTETADIPVELFKIGAAQTPIPLRVNIFDKQLGVILDYGFIALAGTGNLNKNNDFTVNLKGLPGMSLQLKGTIAAFAVLGNTNATIKTISSIAEKGKVFGQAVEGKGFFSSF